MPPAVRRTSMTRVVVALLVAYLLPSLAMGQAFFWWGDAVETRTPLQAAWFAAPSLVMGLMLGWPYVAGAAGCWAVLARFDRHYAWAAALLGLAAGAGVALTGAKVHRLAAVAFCLGLGLLTALLVWWIAYGRQARLPAPRPIRRPSPAMN
ncbi:MAG: hypothetical protein J7521_11105 [Caulobacter sp.]|nr:hypothetical protein [Caulobacter sp.]